jgi:stage III sporulation protein AC
MHFADLVFKIAGLAIVITVIQVVLKQAGKDDWGYLTVLAGITIALSWIIPAIVNLFETVRSVFQLY